MSIILTFSTFFDIISILKSTLPVVSAAQGATLTLPT